jgi:hypothetical protein
MSKFRFQGKRLFLTYSQCTVPPSAAMSLIKNFFDQKKKDLEWLLVSQENHQDSDGLHLHVLVCLKQKIHLSNCRALDLKVEDQTYHPKIEPIRNLQASIVYVCKEKKDLSNVVGWNCTPKLMLQAAKKKTSTKMASAASMIMEGKSLMDVVQQDPGLVLMHLEKMKKFEAWWKHQQSLDVVMEDFLGCKSVNQENLEDLTICKWINSNFGCIRPPRTRQLWIYGTTRLGKTHLLQTLMRFFKGYGISSDGRFDQAYDDRYDFAFADEFIGTMKTVTWMNEFTEGTVMKLNQKGGDPVIKRKNLPVIICSNMSIKGCYPGADISRVEALEDRFIQVQVFSQINLKFDFDEGDESEDTAPMLSESSCETTEEDELIDV